MADGNVAESSKVSCRTSGEEKRALLWLLGGAMLVLIVALPVLDLTPTVWIDEVMIVDFGRCLLEPDTDWAVTLDANGHAAIAVQPVYLLLQQVVFAVTGTKITATRAISLFSAVGAAVALWYYLRMREVKPVLSTCVALMFLCDPLFACSYFGARADAFTILMCLVAVTAWYRAANDKNIRDSFLAGSFSALGVFSWPTAPVTLAIALGDYVRDIVTRRRLLVKQVLVASLGFGVVGIAALSFVVAHLDHTRVAHDRISLPGVTEVVRTIVATYTRSPWMLLVFGGALVMTFRKRHLLWPLGIVLVAGGIACSVPPFYSWRLVYVLPAAYVFIGIAFDSISTWRKPIERVCVVLVFLSFSVNIAGRTAMAVCDREQRDYQVYSDNLASLIAEGAVVVGDFSCYYAGLENGWKMFCVNFNEKIAERFTEWYWVQPLGSGSPPQYDGFVATRIGECSSHLGPGRLGTAPVYGREVYLYRRISP